MVVCAVVERKCWLSMLAEGGLAMQLCVYATAISQHPVGDAVLFFGAQRPLRVGADRGRGPGAGMVKRKRRLV